MPGDSACPASADVASSQPSSSSVVRPAVVNASWRASSAAARSCSAPGEQDTALRPEGGQHGVVDKGRQ
jgi:hypothetical protein